MSGRENIVDTDLLREKLLPASCDFNDIGSDTKKMGLPIERVVNFILESLTHSAESWKRGSPELIGRLIDRLKEKALEGI